MVTKMTFTKAGDVPNQYSVHSLAAWLKQRESTIWETVLNTVCKKWYKWLHNSETPYPCVCPVRNKGCIQFELYYEILKVVEIHSYKLTFKKALEEYNVCYNEKGSLFAWAKKYEVLGSKLFFTPTITILSDSKTNDKLTIQLNPNEFSTVLQFQELFNSVYYSDEFQTNKVNK